MRTKGRFIFKKRWYSFCGAHHEYKETCNACNSGTWSNIYIDKIEDIIYKLFPQLWIWWVNKK